MFAASRRVKVLPYITVAAGVLLTAFLSASKRDTDAQVSNWRGCGYCLLARFFRPGAITDAVAAENSEKLRDLNFILL
ncbi:MAG: hypothetical protein A2Z83_00995 [Omnitrophica bacterium GWA2_52_8]|nr:MAG: hypothetical protein A2Z83_00995 [Omnitrophica bacterium GWA2_52_8]